MPNEKNVQTQYLGPTNNPDTYNEANPYPDTGALGQVLERNNRTYQFEHLDSGAAALAAPAANDVLFWKDRTTYLVTTDSRFSNGARNNVAGVLRVAATAGRYVFALQRGDAISVKSDGNGAAGDIAIANSGTSADITRVAAGTAPTYQILGKVTAAASGGFIAVDLNIDAAP